MKIAEPVIDTPVAERCDPIPAPTATTSTINLEDLGKNLLAITSEKTGYPIEMLEFEMDMEADLGIDSIKRVEILGALQELSPDLPKPNLEELGDKNAQLVKLLSIYNLMLLKIAQ